MNIHSSVDCQDITSHKIIDISSTYELIHDMRLNESDINLTNYLNISNSKSQINKIFHKPMGIIITDTYNNPLFPIRPSPRLDTSKFELPLVKLRFNELYRSFKPNFLPWHFVIEFVKSEYFVFNTRPLDMKFPVTIIEAESLIKDNGIELNEHTINFFKNKPFNLNISIHITLIGDSYKDVYLNSIYELIGETCIRPILRYFKLAPIIGTIICPLNIGKNFKVHLLEQYIK